MPIKLVWIALAGGLGTLCRYGLAGLVQSRAGGSLPWGTFSVNLLGSLLAGFFWALADKRILISGELRGIVLIGFMGGFTTFSALMLESNALFRDGEWIWGLGNLAGQNLLGCLACFLGIVAGRLI